MTDAPKIEEVILGNTYQPQPKPAETPKIQFEAPEPAAGTTLSSQPEDRFPSLKGGSTAAATVSGKEERWIETSKPDPWYKRMLSKSWWLALVIWAGAFLFLWLVQPPIVCKTNSRDDLDAYTCSFPRLLVWSAIAPLLYFVLPLLNIV